jgi:hypothetical protein
LHHKVAQLQTTCKNKSLSKYNRILELVLSLEILFPKKMVAIINVDRSILKHKTS